MEMGSMGEAKTWLWWLQIRGWRCLPRARVPLYIVSRILVSPSWAAMKRTYLGRPDSESGEFYVPNVRREIPYNFVIEEFSV
jgi:hypothetical protein